MPTVTVTYGELPEIDRTQPAQQYLELNTKTHERVYYDSLKELESAEARRNIKLELEPLAEFYNRAASAAAPGWIFISVLSSPILITGLWLLRALHRLRLQCSPIASQVG